MSWEAFAQTATSVIFGTVTDASGSSVPNVTVTATNAATQVSERVTTNEAGNYVFPNLRPGTYTVYWHVVSVDTHRTEGSLKFVVAQ